MQIEIDQSGKIEQTNHVTVIALTNGTKYTILFSRNDKRYIEKISKQTGFKSVHPQTTFAILIAIIVIKSKVNKSILIDTEYPGYNEYIRKIVNLLVGKKCSLIKFGFVGKESKSDLLARKIAHNKEGPSYKVNRSEITKYLTKIKKSRSA